MRIRTIGFLVLITLVLSACTRLQRSESAILPSSMQTPAIESTPATESMLVSESTSAPTPTQTPVPTPTPTPKQVSLSLRFVGDLMCCNYQMAGAWQEDGSFDFRPPFALIQNELAGADLLLGNFETNIVPSLPLCGDKDGFNAPPEYLDAIKSLGFDVLFTANNHALDCGVSGALSTLDAIRAHGMEPIGTNAAPEDVEKIYIRKINGLNVAILAYADRTNKKKVELNGESAYWAFNYFTEERLINDISLAREQGAELIVMYLHEGREKLVTPNSDQFRAAEAAFTNGVDLVVMSHTHSLLTMERRELETANGTKQVFCAYGLGNFMSSAIHKESLNNVILNLNVTYDRELQGLSALDPEYLLTYTVNYYDSNRAWQFVIVPMEQALADFSMIDPRTRVSERRLLKAYNDMRKRLDTYTAAESVSTFSREGGA